MHYRHFTMSERRRIAECLEERIPAAEIARRLGRARSSVCAEIRRNRRPDGLYLASTAEEKARARAHRPRGAYKKDNCEILDAIEAGLSKKWSPRIIAAKLKEAHPSDRRRQASHQTIYELIWEDKRHGGAWYKGLPHGGRKRRKRYGTRETRGRIRNRVGIEARPAVVDSKARIGDWEGDTIVGVRGKSGLASFAERATQYVVLQRVKDGTAAALNRSARRGFRRHGPLPAKTMTLDNGREFAGHERLAKELGLDVYFARPYHAWERGLNEQINGMVRWWFPKGTDFSTVSAAEIRRVEKLLNERPRETLGYRTPAEVMCSNRVRLQI